MRWILRAVGVIVILAMLAVAGLLLIPDQRIAAYVGQKFQEATGRELKITGEIGPMVWPMLGVRLEGIEIANAGWAADAPMLKAEGLLVGVNPVALLSGEVKIRKIELLRPRIRLERAANGQGNWEFAAPAGAGGANGNGSAGNGSGGEAGSGVPPFSLERAIIREGALAWIDHRAGSRMDLAGMDATLRIPDFTGPASIDMKALAEGQPLEAKLEIGRFDRFIEGGSVPLAADLSVAGNRLLFDGEAGFAPLLAEGAVDGDLARLPALFAALGMAAPDIPEGLGRKAALKGRVAYSGEGGGRVVLKGAEITLDQNKLSGDLELALGGKRPRLTGSLASPLLDLSALTGGGEEKAGGGAAEPGDSTAQEPWPSDPIDVSPLSLLDADLSLDLGGLKLAGANIDRARLGFTLDRARAVLAFREVSAYGGSVAGQFVVNGRGGLSVGGDLAVADAALQPLLRDMADYERLIGTGDFSIKFLGVGNSMAAIMRSLKGEGALNLADGEILGLDLVGMLRHFDTSYRGEGKKTIYDAITASFVIRDGVLQNDDLLFKAPLATAKGKGRVDIGAKTIDYRVEPVALAKADGTGGIAVPIIIKGPWADPSFRPDLAAIAAERAGVDKEELKDRVDEAVRDAVTQKLGIDRTEGEGVEDAVRRELGVAPEEEISTEDAVKRKLEEEAKKGILDLLGR